MLVVLEAVTVFGVVRIGASLLFMHGHAELLTTVTGQMAGIDPKISQTMLTYKPTTK